MTSKDPASPKSLEEFTRIQERFEHRIQELLSKNQDIAPSEKPIQETYSPRYNLYTDQQALYLDIELAGVYENDINILLEEGYLRVEGEFLPTADEESLEYFIKERPEGKFSYMLPISTDYLHSQVEFQWSNGLLHIKLIKDHA